MSEEKKASKVREKYDTEVKRLKNLYAKRDEQKKRVLLGAVEKSNKSYEEIITFYQ